MNYKLALFIIIIILNSCLTAGTHGSIKSYEYLTNKFALQKAIETIIATNPNVRRDTTDNYTIDITNERNDTIQNNYYNDGENYLTIYIKVNGGSNEYTIRYAGDQKYWDTSRKSEIFIAYAHDKNGNGGSEGNGGVKWYNWVLKKRLLMPFEKEIIYKLDSILNQKHTDPD